MRTHKTCGFASDYGNLDRIKLVNVFNQKRKLNLISDNNLVSFSYCSCSHWSITIPIAKYGFAMCFAICQRAQMSICRIATASFLGYGLYDQGIHSLDSAWGRFSEYISSKGP